MTMREKIARAITETESLYATRAEKDGRRAWFVRNRDDGEGCLFEPVSPGFETEKEAEAHLRMMRADAVIVAMREPTKEMLDAAGGAFLEGIKQHAGENTERPFALFWRAMLDAAKGETE